MLFSVKINLRWTLLFRFYLYFRDDVCFILSVQGKSLLDFASDRSTEWFLNLICRCVTDENGSADTDPLYLLLISEIRQRQNLLFLRNDFVKRIRIPADNRYFGECENFVVKVQLWTFILLDKLILPAHTLHAIKSLLIETLQLKYFVLCPAHHPYTSE